MTCLSEQFKPTQITQTNGKLSEMWVFLNLPLDQETSLGQKKGVL